jgi:hypothetical protein
VDGASFVGRRSPLAVRPFARSPVRPFACSPVRPFARSPFAGSVLRWMRFGFAFEAAPREGSMYIIAGIL